MLITGMPGIGTLTIPLQQLSSNAFGNCNRCRRQKQWLLHVPWTEPTIGCSYASDAPRIVRFSFSIPNDVGGDPTAPHGVTVNATGNPHTTVEP